MPEFQKHLLVDGWNIIRSEAAMSKAFSELGQDSAKKMLAARLSPIHDIFGYRLTIVYDGKGDEISIEKIGQSDTFCEVYTPSSLTADELIEQYCANSKNPKSITVASRDNLIRLTAMGFKVESITASQLLGWADDAASHARKKYDAVRKNASDEWKKASSPFADIESRLKKSGPKGGAAK